MSDETAPTPKKSPAAATPRVRRVSAPRPKKVVKNATEAAEQDTSIPVKVTGAATPAAAELPDDASAPSSVGSEWPEPEAEFTGEASSQSESTKRKRRRRKGKGQANGMAVTNEEHSSPLPLESLQEPRPLALPAAQRQPQRAKIDPELLTKMAWKIYLAEVSEEGVALIGDADAKDLSRRCFRLAEIFIEEQSRRR